MCWVVFRGDKRGCWASLQQGFNTLFIKVPWKLLKGLVPSVKSLFSPVLSIHQFPWEVGVINAVRVPRTLCPHSPACRRWWKPVGGSASSFPLILTKP